MGSEANGHLNLACNFSRETKVLLNDMHTMMAGMIECQKSMALSASSMADSNAASEVRYGKTEERLQEANDKAAGKNQIPLMTHLIIVGTILLSMLLIVTFTTKQTVEGTMNSLKVEQGK